jgi:hypothetical protein
MGKCYLLMEKPIFLLVKDQENECRELIFHRDSELKIKVIGEESQGWQLNPNELQLYADNNGERLIFETVDFQPDEPGLVIEGIRWYAQYIGNPELEIEAELE